MRDSTNIYLRDSGEILAGNGSDVESFDELAKAVFHLALDDADDQFGTVDGIGWYGLVLGVLVQYEDTNYLAETKHYIVREDSQGFKYCEDYSSASVATAMFQKIVDENGGDDDDDDDYDDDDYDEEDYNDDDDPSEDNSDDDIGDD
jgi:hypothetical protein